MIVKGSARKDGHALAVYFMKSEDGARLIFSSDPMGNTLAAMTEWDEIGRLTRGEKPIYHMQLCPDAKYPVSDEQYKRMAEIVLEELGATGHDYELYFHPGVKEDGQPDKPHAHLGVCRTNRDTLKMFDLSFNYLAHERASLRIAKELGMEIVPGKHAKRDRKKQKDFPRAEASRADHQQAARTELTVEQRKEQVTALRAAADNAQAFKAALEDAGYVLAKGDKRGLVIVDEQGEIYSLSKQVTDIKGKEFKAFMEPIDTAKLPSVDEAKAEQERRKLATVQIWGEEAQKQGVEASKFLQHNEPAKAPEPAPAPHDEKLERLKKDLAERQAGELQKWYDWHPHELRQLEFQLDKELADKIAVRQADELKELAALKETIRERTTGLKGFMQAMENRWNPQLGAERARERRREIAQLKRRQEKERADYLALMEQTKQLEIENLKARQALQLRDLRQKHIEETERYIRDHEEGKRIAEQIEAEERQREKNESLREGPPPPKLGK